MNFVVFDKFWAPSEPAHSVPVGLVFGSWSWNSRRNCLAQARSLAPSQQATYPASVMLRQTMSCFREYHSTGCCPNVRITPVCDWDSGPPYEASAYASSWSFKGRFIVTSSDLVEYRYPKTFSAA